MSDLLELKKLMEGNTKAISALIHAESNSDRIKQEMASNNRKLEDLHAQIKTAESDLEKAKAEANRVLADATKNASEIKANANTESAEADNRLAKTKMLERQAQTKLDEAEGLKAKYAEALAEVTAQKEKLKAALV